MYVVKKLVTRARKKKSLALSYSKPYSEIESLHKVTYKMYWRTLCLYHTYIHVKDEIVFYNSGVYLHIFLDFM